MKKIMIMACALCFVLAGCGESAVPEDISVADRAPETAATAAAEETAAKVASPEETAPVIEVVEEGMTPIYADALNDGVYEVEVKSSSSMFEITACTLTVENGTMTAEMTMGGTGYLYLFMGMGEEASAAQEGDYIPFVETDGVHHFTVPVEALDAGVDCAAFSKRNEQWYNRTLLFRADSLPDEAFRESRLVTAESLALEDGE